MMKGEKTQMHSNGIAKFLGRRTEGSYCPFLGNDCSKYSALDRRKGKLRAEEEEKAKKVRKKDRIAHHVRGLLIAEDTSEFHFTFWLPLCV